MNVPFCVHLNFQRNVCWRNWRPRDFWLEQLITQTKQVENRRYFVLCLSPHFIITLLLWNLQSFLSFSSHTECDRLSEFNHFHFLPCPDCSHLLSDVSSQVVCKIYSLLGKMWTLNVVFHFLKLLIRVVWSLFICYLCKGFDS